MLISVADVLDGCFKIRLKNYCNTILLCFSALWKSMKI